MTITISELASRTCAAPSALRFYERRGLLRPVGRAGGKRTYDERAVEQVAVVDLLKRAGFTLGEIAELVDADGRIAAGWRERARAKVAQLDEQIKVARRAKDVIEHSLACPHPTPDQCPVFRGHVAAHARAMRRS